MGMSSFRRFDVQARWSLLFSVAAMLTCMPVAFLALKNWRSDINQILFSAKTMFQPAYMGGCALAILLACFGTALGFNSAGQRRNDRQKQSWLGFFLGVAALLLAILLLVAFMLLKYQITKKT